MSTINDASVPYGSVVMTNGSLGFIGENISASEPSTVIEVRDELGNPTDQVIVSGFKVASATVQFPASATPVPTVGSVWFFAPVGATASTWYCSEVGSTISQLEIKKCNLSFRAKLN